MMLGVGSSAGTPVIGCQCQTCRSNNPKNKRLRCSAAIMTDQGDVILIDTGPDLRAQSLRAELTRADAVLYTHTHADHLHGIDDLRAFCQIQKKQIPLYGKSDAMQHIQDKFGYAIRPAGDFWDLPVLSLNPITGPFELFGLTITPIPVKHGYSDILGYRIGNMAYLTDVSDIPASSMSLLKNLDILMLDCLRYTPHYTHINVEQSLAFAGKINALDTYLIHMTHDIDYDKLSTELPDHIHVAFDGLKLNF
ncbi:Beta-lactamase domain protein [Candidatus Methylopumilus turicensis]|uniref:Beta-lactamase domain protein n=2 Tax=Candidatus Methylopumilus turicensis TaxID=1581680 RepID=A0A0B7IZT1_9PROT|nr:Beta-lactamase domain protein [Candidatus Methylopumilus turicensis]